MKENVFTREIKNSILRSDWAEHPIPSTYGGNGLPDIIACFRGRFVGIENKLVTEFPKNPTIGMLRHKFTRIQEIRANDIIKAGGIAFGLINIRHLKIALVTEVKESVNPTEAEVAHGKTWDYIQGETYGLWPIKILLVERLERGQ